MALPPQRVHRTNRDRRAGDRRETRNACGGAWRWSREETRIPGSAPLSLSLQARAHFRDSLRDGRHAALKDSEGYQQLLFVVVRLGTALTGKVGALGTYGKSISELAEESPLARTAASRAYSEVSFDQLYDWVRQARNDALHQGALARHLTTNLVRIALILEDALMARADRVCDFMVREVVIAHPWQAVMSLRQILLVNSFSYLPVSLGGAGWRLLADAALVRYLRTVDDKEKKRRLATPLVDAVERDRLSLEEAGCVPPERLVGEVLEEAGSRPLLVTHPADQSQLLGILTAFDLL